MPYSITLNRYTFILNQQTKLILDLFQKACEQYYKSERKEDKLSSDLAISDNQQRKGFIPKLLKTIENINEKKYGSSFVTLSPVESIHLDSEADKMLEAYCNEINNVFYKNNLQSFDMSREDNITSAALVFRVLLLRLVTIALCDDNTYVRDGEALLKIYSNFIDQVLYHMDEFSEKDIFQYFSTKEHLDWMHAIRQVVLAVKLIHSHQDNITECLTTIKSLSYNIQRMILAHLVIANTNCKWPIFSKLGSPQVLPTDLEDAFVENKVYEYEKFLASKNKRKDDKDVNNIMQAIDITTYAAIEHLGRKQKGKSILDAIDLNDNPQLGALLAIKNNNCPEKIYERLEALYSLYFKSRCLLICLEQIDSLITTCSWVPLVTGSINLSQVCKLIRLHCEMCTELLSIANNDMIYQLPFKQVIMQKSFRAQTQLTEMHKRILELEELQNPSRIEKIKYQVMQNINNLLEVQGALEVSLLQYNANHKTSISTSGIVTQPKPTSPSISTDTGNRKRITNQANYPSSRFFVTELQYALQNNHRNGDRELQQPPMPKRITYDGF